MKRLIVNADDFGMCEAVDRGIARAHKEGIVTSASLLACGESAGHAARLARENPGLGVGVHLCLTMLAPLTAPDKLPSITRSGRFHQGPLQFVPRLLFGLVDKREVMSELRAQVVRAIDLGIRPTHLDGHQHIHIMPGIFHIVAEIAQEFGIDAVRFPVGPWTGRTSLFSTLEKLALESLSRTQEGYLRRMKLRRPDGFFGLPQTGRLDAKSIVSIAEALPEGTSELMCHPGEADGQAAARLGWGHGWQAELDALTDPAVRDALSGMGIELVSYNSL